MVVLNDICENCNYVCNAIYFQRNFSNWTSGNNDIDKFIQDSQLSAHETSEVLEWIPYSRFYDIKCIAKSGFDKVYKANWIDGCIDKWNNNQNWKRKGQNMIVILKILNNPTNNVTLEFMNKV